MSATPKDSYLRFTAQALAVDVVTAEVAGELEAAGVPHALMKGPAIAEWLYPGDVRHYVDTDLLVQPEHYSEGEGCLASLRFARAFGPLPHPRMHAPLATEWVRGGEVVDLHVSLRGAQADASAVWAALAPSLDEQVVAGRTVKTLGETVRLVLVVLHVAHHGERHQGPLRDLERALERVPTERFATAQEFAARIGAEEAFAAGLGSHPAGRRLATRLSIDTSPSAARLYAASPVPLVAGFEALARTPRVRRKIALLVAEVVPSRDFIRWWSPIARRGRVGLAAAYVGRILWLLVRTPRAFSIWLAIRRRGDHERSA